MKSTDFMNEMWIRQNESKIQLKIMFIERNSFLSAVELTFYLMNLDSKTKTATFIWIRILFYKPIFKSWFK